MKPTKTVKAKKISFKKKAQKEFSHIQFHGAKMLASGESSWYWVPLLLLLLVSAIALIHLAVSRFRSNPTFMAYKESNSQLMNFPCVLVYPELAFHESKKEQFISSITYPDGLNKTYIRAIIDQLAAFWSPDVIYKLRDLENIEELLKYNDLDVETAAKKLIFSCEEIVLREMREHAKVKKSEIENNQWNTPRSGISSGLVLAIDQSQKLNSIDLSYKWIVVQVGQRYVDTTLNGTALNPGYEQWIIYQEDRYYINDRAKDLGTTLRNCRMGDQPLKYFPYYRNSGLDFNRVTIVRIFIQAGLHKTFQRFSFFTYLDLSAQLGGIFNVFFGCSIFTLLGLIHVAWRISVNELIKYLKKLLKSDHKKNTPKNPKEKRP
ncbi:unnamed protein product [Arctia plantaginis]|uniref:Uncharacterized protein n=1 Tax=Arctia plantaginis TaxID=874455 RepID=A0A8S0YTJ1_ARCPL|nr:unnamed protein product [Arctia plantaginis]